MPPRPVFVSRTLRQGLAEKSLYAETEGVDAAGVDPTDGELNATLHFLDYEDSDDDEEYPPYHNHKREWRLRLGHSFLSNDTSFGLRRKLLAEHFGLDVWTSHVRLLPDSDSTVAYLTLPNATVRREEWTLRESEGGFPSICESGYGMVVDLDKRPDSKALRSFLELCGS